MQGSGRETDKKYSKPWDNSYRSDDPTRSKKYHRNYEYDKMGNILKMAHIREDNDGSTNFTRLFNPSNGSVAPVSPENVIQICPKFGKILI